MDSLCSQIRGFSKERGVAMSGPVPLPTKKLRVPVRKGPDGCGTSTIDHWEMRIYQRLIDVDADEDVMHQIIRAHIPDGVHIEVRLL